MFLSCLMLGMLTAAQPADIVQRPPAVPLVAIDPYTSVWSPTDRLYDSWPMHWTGRPRAMTGIIRVDGTPLRFMGVDSNCKATANQTGLTVLPTRTIYQFNAGPINLKLTFFTPMLPDDFSALTAPVTYVLFECSSLDKKPHDVQIYFDITAEWCVNEVDQEVTWSRMERPGFLPLMKMGSKEQPVLAKAGDDIRIDWGHLYVGAPQLTGAQTAIGGSDAFRSGFVKGVPLPTEDDSRQPRAANDDWPVSACTFDMPQVDSKTVRRHLMLAYDDLYSIEYMQKQLRPWWFKAFGSFEAMFDSMGAKMTDYLQRCAAMDDDLMTDADRAGGKTYASLLAITYRHVFASGKTVVGPDDQPWYFHKECFSNGCTGTVDVSYPASPFFALFAPRLLRGMMAPVFDFARTPTWTFDFAPHDVGCYPKANGQVYNPGKLEGQMPVEECGNMILMAALLTKADGNAQYAEQQWDILTKWAQYLEEKGLDPENQLCTDDFAGHLAHNTNLSLKAINALGAYAMMAEMLGKPEAANFKRSAKEMAAQWIIMADDGDHYRLTFDKKKTWSLKYNLVWDNIFGLGLFPESVAEKEVAHYLAVSNKYGVPLDNRKDYTKTDWLVWAASMAKDNETFGRLIEPIARFCNETPDRIPFTDWYDTENGKCVGFRARPVMGGIFIRLLSDAPAWSRWRARALEAENQRIKLMK